MGAAVNYLCLIAGHRVVVRFGYNGRLKLPTHRRPAVAAVAVCARCGKQLSSPANPPRGTR